MIDKGRDRGVSGNVSFEASEALDYLVETVRQSVLSIALSEAAGREVGPRDIASAYRRTLGPVDELLAMERSYKRAYLTRSKLSLMVSIVTSVFIVFVTLMVTVGGLPQELADGSALSLVLLIVLGVTTGVALGSALIQARSARRTYESHLRFNRMVQELFQSRDISPGPQLPEPASGSEDFSSDYLVEWGGIEDRLRVLAQPMMNSSARPALGLVLSRLERSGLLDAQLAEEIRVGLRVRNKLAHGEPMSRRELRVASTGLESVGAQLDEIRRSSQ